MRITEAILLAALAASAGYIAGTKVERPPDPAPAPRVAPVAPRSLPGPVEIHDGVPGSSLQPAVSADMYVERMGRLRESCVSEGNRFGVLAVEEGVFGECWDPRRDDRAWAEWVAVRR